MGSPVTLTDPNGNYVDISGGGGSGGGSVTVTNFPATQAVSGPLTNAQLRASAVPVSVAGAATETSLAAVSMSVGEINADLGTVADAAWSGTGSGTVIALLKAIHAQNVTIISSLATIATNTTPAG